MSYDLRLGSCLANTTALNWYDASSYCAKMYVGAHLIDIESDEEQTIFADMFGNIRQLYACVQL